MLCNKLFMRGQFWQVHKVNLINPGQVENEKKKVVRPTLTIFGSERDIQLETKIHIV